MEKGTFTRQEIHSQPEAWSEAIQVLEQNRRGILELHPAEQFDYILFTGCGSTYYLALAAAALCQQLTGIPCRAFPASELWLNPGIAYVDRKSLLVAISRSGETTETIQACASFLQDRRGVLLTLSCYEDMPLAKMGDVNILLPSGREQSVAQTRAFTTLFLSTVALASLWSGRTDLFSMLSLLPEAGRKVIQRAAPLAAEVGSDTSIDRFYWLGSGPRYGLAAELSLKMKEMSLSHSEPFHFLEFRHGPKSMVMGKSMVIGLKSSHNANRELAVIADMKALGGRVLTMGEEDSSFEFKSNLDDSICDILFLPLGQLIAFERALSKGLNPDLPTNLDAVVKLLGGE